MGLNVLGTPRLHQVVVMLTAQLFLQAAAVLEVLFLLTFVLKGRFSGTSTNIDVVAHFAESTPAFWVCCGRLVRFDVGFEAGCM